MLIRISERYLSPVILLLQISQIWQCIAAFLHIILEAGNFKIKLPSEMMSCEGLHSALNMEPQHYTCKGGWGTASALVRTERKKS